jgi:hypothetical protein
MTDHRFDGGAAFHLAPDRSGDVAHLAADPDPELLPVIVTALAFVDMNAARGDPGLPLQVGDHWAERVTVSNLMLTYTKLLMHSNCAGGPTVCSLKHLVRMRQMTKRGGQFAMKFAERQREVLWAC